MIAVLILLEDGHKSVVDLLRFFVLLGLAAKAEEELANREESKTPDHGHDSGA